MLKPEFKTVRPVGRIVLAILFSAVVTTATTIAGFCADTALTADEIRTNEIGTDEKGPEVRVSAETAETGSTLRHSTLPTQSTSPSTAPLTWEETARQIDQIFAESWQAQQVTPAPLADDSEFLRRVWLDLAGRIPSISEARQFLSDSNAKKRTELVEQLLDSPTYVRHFTIVWRKAIIPQASEQVQFRGLIPGFDAWLWQHIAENSPYDQLVREIITTPVRGAAQNGVLNSASSPEAFFLSRELRPENLAAGTSRAFLGVRLDCAQCHDHPFDKWKQAQFWNLAAFYAGFGREGDTPDSTPLMQAGGERSGIRTIQIPGTEKMVPAVFLTGKQPEWAAESVSSRDVLAQWVTDRNNPYFARMAANRMWAQFFGQGIVQPIDDFSDNNPPSHPEVLELLAEQLVAHDYDLKFLIRTITATRVYQTASQQTDPGQSDPAHFARSALRGLTPEQFFDSLAEAVGFYQPYRSGNPFVLDDSSARTRYLELYRDEAESPLQRETTILQALAMMNGEFVDNATSIERSRTLRAVADFPLMNDEQKLETLFLATLSRPPSSKEHQQFYNYLSSGGATGEKNTALSDIFWVLLNSSEFLLNH